VDNALRFLGLCRKAGALLTGEDGVSGAVRSGKAALLMTAADTAENTTKKALNLSRSGNIPQVRLPWDKDTLGELLDKRVCAILAVTDRGLAAAFAEKLAVLDPAYGELAALLREKPSRKGRKAHG
jgi:ribosomal protein L7Ae-like RNA K-turn-binding protein